MIGSRRRAVAHPPGSAVINGHAIEVRINARTAKGFMPNRTVTALKRARGNGVRFDSMLYPATRCRRSTTACSAS